MTEPQLRIDEGEDDLLPDPWEPDPDADLDLPDPGDGFNPDEDEAVLPPILEDDPTMTSFVTYLQTGKITQVGRVKVENIPELLDEPGEAVIYPIPDVGVEDDIIIDSTTHYIDTGNGNAITERIPLAPIVAGPRPYTVDMTNVDKVTVINEGGYTYETEDPADPIRLVDDGWYTFVREATFPYLDSTEAVYFA